MDIPMKAAVKCSDSLCGYLTCVIVNPTTQKVTHVVVKDRRPPHTERLVPENFILESTPDSVLLRCSAGDLTKFDEYVGLRFIRTQLPVNFPTGIPTAYWPYVVTEEVDYASKEERIPPGELAFHRGARVEASDGPVGQVDEFLVDPTDGKITHMILREGHLWGQKDITIPISAIEKISDGAVWLKLSKKAIASLPAIPANRKWK